MNRNDRSLDVLLGKIRILMSHDQPERGAAIAAIDQFLRDHGHRSKDDDARLIDDESHIEDIGICERTCHALDTIDVWFVGQLRIMTYDQLADGVKIGRFMIMEMIRCLDNHGVTHAISIHSSESSSESEECYPEADPMDQLLESWLEPRAASV